MLLDEAELGLSGGSERRGCEAVVVPAENGGSRQPAGTEAVRDRRVRTAACWVFLSGETPDLVCRQRFHFTPRGP